MFARTSLALGAALLVVALAAHVAGVRFNYTTSIPRGLYLASDFDPADVRPGQLVEACPSREGAEAVAAYLPGGPCPGGVIRLGKEVVGLPGDRVTVDSAGVAVNGVRLPRSTPLFYDRTGRPLYPWLGEYAIGPGSTGSTRPGSRRRSTPATSDPSPTSGPNSARSSSRTDPARNRGGVGGPSGKWRSCGEKRGGGLTRRRSYDKFV